MRISTLFFSILFLAPVPSLLNAQQKETDTKILSLADSTCPIVPNFNLSAKPPLFSVTTDISLELPSSGVISLRIYDFDGRLVRTIASGSLDSGWHHFSWNGTSDSGMLLPSGIYTCIASGLGRSDYAKIDFVR